MMSMLMAMAMAMAITVLRGEKPKVPMVRQPTMRVAFVRVDKHKLRHLLLRLSTALLYHLVLMFLNGRILPEVVAHGIQMLMAITVIGMEKKEITQVPVVRQPPMRVAFVGVDKDKQALVNLDLLAA